MEEVGVAINELKSVEEIKKYLKREIDSLVKRTIVLSEFIIPLNLKHRKLLTQRETNNVTLAT